MKLDSLVRSINRRIDDIVDYYGLESEEYMKQKAFLYNAIPESLKTYGKNKALHVKRGKMISQDLKNNIELLQNLYDWQIREGTAREQAQQPRYQGLTRKQIKEVAPHYHDMKKQSSSFIYDAFTELEESEEKRSLEEILHSRLGTHGSQANEIFQRFTQRLLQYQQMENKRILENAGTSRKISRQEMYDRIQKTERLRSVVKKE